MATIFLQMEDDPNFVLVNLGSWFLVFNIVSTQLDEIWKTNIFFLNGRWPQLFLNGRQPQLFFEMEDNLNSFENGRRRQYFENRRWYQFFENGRWPQFFLWKRKTTSFFINQKRTNLFDQMTNDLNILVNLRWPLKKWILCSFQEQHSTQKILAQLKKQTPNQPQLAVT